MRVLVLVAGLGLALFVGANAATNDWVALSYDEPDGWIFEVPGVDGGRVLYGVSLPAPVGDEPREYPECDVFDYDMEAGRMTLACPGRADVVLEFDCLWDYFSPARLKDVGERASSFPVGETCDGGSCECVDKCWACCPKGFVPSCNCVREGRCKCVAVTAVADDDFVS